MKKAKGDPVHEINIERCENGFRITIISDYPRPGASKKFVATSLAEMTGYVCTANWVGLDGED